MSDPHIDSRRVAELMEQAGFELTNPGYEHEIYLRDDWRIMRLDPGRDRWICYEGETRWLIGSLEAALRVYRASIGAPPEED